MCVKHAFCWVLLHTVKAILFLGRQNETEYTWTERLKEESKEQRQNKKEHIERSSIFQSAVIPSSHTTVERSAVNVQFFSSCFKKALEMFSFVSPISVTCNKYVDCCTSRLCWVL
jgi:hypothetical protein